MAKAAEGSTKRRIEDVWKIFWGCDVVPMVRGRERTVLGKMARTGGRLYLSFSGDRKMRRR